MPTPYLESEASQETLGAEVSRLTSSAVAQIFVQPLAISPDYRATIVGSRSPVCLSTVGTI